MGQLPQTATALPASWSREASHSHARIWTQMDPLLESRTSTQCWPPSDHASQCTASPQPRKYSEHASTYGHSALAQHSKYRAPAGSHRKGRGQRHTSMSERSLSISACMWERALSASAVRVAIVDSLAANSAWYSSAALRTCHPPQCPVSTHEGGVVTDMSLYFCLWVQAGCCEHAGRRGSTDTMHSSEASSKESA